MPAGKGGQGSHRATGFRKIPQKDGGNRLLSVRQARSSASGCQRPSLLHSLHRILALTAVPSSFPAGAPGPGCPGLVAAVAWSLHFSVSSSCSSSVASTTQRDLGAHPREQQVHTVFPDPRTGVYVLCTSQCWCEQASPTPMSRRAPPRARQCTHAAAMQGGMYIVAEETDEPSLRQLRWGETLQAQSSTWKTSRKQ